MFQTRIISAAMATATALLFAAQPTFANVKAGVDAWSKGDYPGAVKQWRDPAAKGDADAQFNMAQAYKLGRGVKQDLNLAAEWYARAAKQGHLQAADSLGHLYHYQGKIALALPFLEGSAKRGEPRSQYLLATELFNGTNIMKDWVRAYALMTRASAAGLAPASRSLAEMDKYIPLDQRQRGVAMAGDIERSAAQVRAAEIAGFPIDTKPPVAVAKPIDVPASKSDFPGDASSANGYETPAPKPVAQPKPAKVSATPPPLKTKPIASPSGKWRVQFGAFGSDANAERLWNSLEARVSDLAALTPYLAESGSIIRLQAGPLSSRAAADALCSKVRANVPGQACIVVVP
ncbi:MAG: SPOR domain-containing protein [Sphingorhabdus sp.]